jgi:chaperonin GroES
VATDYNTDQPGDKKAHSASLELLQEYADSRNIAVDMNGEQRDEIGRRVKREYDIDKDSQKEWEECNEEAMKLALQVVEPKMYPWKGAANVKYPLLTTASIQFAARAYPAILGQGNPVKAKVVGEDEGKPVLDEQGQPVIDPETQQPQWEIPPGHKRNRGDRVARHMSYQLTEEMVEWEEDTDRLLHILPITGLVYRKSYFSPELDRNKSELVLGHHLTVNKNAKSLETVPRATHYFELYPNQIQERIRDETFIDANLGIAENAGDDDDAPHIFLEQHRRLDLDKDGYAEPYIVTIHQQTSKVMRIVANYEFEEIHLNTKREVAKINPVEYFTKYSFIPNPDGSFHDIGFGFLLRPINESINTTLNLMLDAGHLANVGGGFIGAGARLKGGRQKFRPGEYKPVDVGGGTLKENIVPMPFPGPNVVLFQLLGLLIEAGKDISSVKDVMTGGGEQAGPNASPTTTLALIEQGMQVFTAIYKRIYRSLKEEYKKLYKLNAKYLDEDTYFRVMDEAEAIGPQDYAEGDFDIIPVADPTVVTNMQKLGRAEYLAQFRDDPYMDGLEIRKRMFDATNIDDIDQLFAKQQAPDPAMLLEADKLDIEKRKLFLDEIDTISKMEEREAKAINLIADAESKEPGQQIMAYTNVLKALNDRAKMEMDRMNQQETQQNVESGTV